MANKRNFSRRHYEAIAKAINVLWTDSLSGNMLVATEDEASYRDGLTDVMTELSRTFFADNNRFSIDRFMAACKKKEN